MRKDDKDKKERPEEEQKPKNDKNKMMRSISALFFICRARRREILQNEKHIVLCFLPHLCLFLSPSFSLTLIMHIYICTHKHTHTQDTHSLKNMTSLDFNELMKKEREKLRLASAAAAAAASATSTTLANDDDHQKDKKNLSSSSNKSNPTIALLRLEPRSPLDLALYKVPGKVEGIYYIPGWLSEKDAQSLLQAIDEAPANTWTNLHNRRLQNLGGTPASAGGGGMRPVPVPAFGQAVFAALVQGAAFTQDAPPNHILLNEYRGGQGIALHKDGPLYLNRVAIVSLGDSAKLEFWDRREAGAGGGENKSCPCAAAVVVEDRSLLVFEGDAYENYWHGILRRRDEDEDDGEDENQRQRRWRRVSLTVRRVLHVNYDKELLETAESLREEKRKDARFLMSITDDRPDLL